MGIATNDMGIAKDGSKKSNYQRGMELKGVCFLLVKSSDLHLPCE